MEAVQPHDSLLMRVGVRCHTEAGLRAARVLAADPSVDYVALFPGSTYVARELPRVDIVGEGWDAIATDGEPDPAWARNRVVTSGRPIGPWSGDLVFGADLTAGIGGCLAAIEGARHDGAARIVLGFTVAGQVPRRGRLLRFPDPVGVRYGRPVPAHEFPIAVTEAIAAPGPETWAGLLIEVSRPGEDLPFRIVGVADERLFLEALALAAGAMAAASGAYPSGLSPAFEASGPYVEAAVRSGLTVAWYSSDG